MSETVVEKETKSSSALDVPWNVVVHNDPVNLTSYVTRVFQKVFGFTRARAQKHMLSLAWRTGRSRWETIEMGS